MISPGISHYRDRHGKVRWRYRKGDICVQLPGQPGDETFNERARLAAAGKVTQRDRFAHPSRVMHLNDFAKDAPARARLRAVGKRVPYSLTQDEVAALMDSQGWRCAISGIVFFQRKRNDPAFRPTLDRIKPAAGYVAGNVRIVAYIVNLAMNKWGEEPLWKLVETMARRLDGRQPSKNAR